MARHGLRRRMMTGLIVYAVLASLAVFAYGFMINEQAERMVWQALLSSEFDRIEARRGMAPDERWTDTETMTLYGDDPRQPMPGELRRLDPGLHDEIGLADGEVVALVRDIDGARWVLALDISDFEQQEVYIAATVLGAMGLMVVLLAFAIAWGVNRLTRPLRSFAQRIAQLRPDRVGGRIELPHDASTELVVIANALNDYVARNEQYVERERAFIDSVSHELRTPISVIGGAAELAVGHPEVPDPVRLQLARIRRTGREIERLITLLLVLAKDPARLARSSDRIALDQLLPEIVDDHRPLGAEKGLLLVLDVPARCDIDAPLPVVQAAIGNLLRNAIEHSDSGEIVVRIDEVATVVIEDPGHGMTPEEISAIYARMARGGRREGGGIGLDLIARLCEHLGWRLDIASRPGRGTTTRLDLSAARAAGTD